MKKTIVIPNFIIPDNLAEICANQKPRPLNICTICKHVKCSCGGCHSRICAEDCSYEIAEAAAAHQSVDGRVWCDECGGNYLPHEH